MSALNHLNQKTVDALWNDASPVQYAGAAAFVAATHPPIYSADFMAALVKQYEAALVKQKGTITEANAEIERLKHRLSETTRGRPKEDKNVVKPEVKVEVIEDSDSDSDVVEVNRVVYNGVTYHREVNSNVLYHPKRHEVVGMWNDGRGRVDVLPINPHED